MEKLILQLKNKYINQIDNIKSISPTEINVKLKDGVGIQKFFENFKIFFLASIDNLTIVKVNIIDNEGNLVESFDTNG